MAFSPQNFWSNTNRKNGFAKTNRFMVTIPFPPVLRVDREVIRSLELQCETAELPGKNLVTQDVKVYGPTYKMAINKQYANEITLSFLCTNDGKERGFFDNWIEYINPNLTNNMRYPAGIDGHDQSYLSTITVTQYNDIRDYYGNDKIINRLQLRYAFPIGYSAQPLNWGDDGFQRLSVQFAYNGFRDDVEAEKQSRLPPGVEISDNSRAQEINRLNNIRAG
jgi:hypothetical protein